MPGESVRAEHGSQPRICTALSQVDDAIRGGWDPIVVPLDGPIEADREYAAFRMGR